MNIYIHTDQYYGFNEPQLFTRHEHEKDIQNILTYTNILSITIL